MSGARSRRGGGSTSTDRISGHEYAADMEGGTNLTGALQTAELAGGESGQWLLWRQVEMGMGSSSAWV